MKKNNKEKNDVLLLIVLVIVIICMIAFFIISRLGSGSNLDKDVSVVETDEEIETETEAATEGTTIDLLDLTVEAVELNEALYTAVGELNQSLQTFYEDNYDSGRLVSVYSYMYDADTMVPIEADEVSENVPDELKYVNLLLIKPGDFEVCENSEYDVDVRVEDIMPFTSVLTDQGYLVSSVDYAGGVLTEDDYRSLIMRYNCSHGEITSPEKGTSAYEMIYNKVAEEWGEGSTVDVKYMGFDDKYGIVVANTLEKPKEFKEYLFTKSGSSWTIKNKKLADKENVKQYVNELYPDLDLALLPYYNLALYDDFKTGLTGYYDTIVANSELGVTEADLTDVYCLYSDGFIYYEFANEKRVVGHVDSEGVLTFYKAESTDQAVALMASLSDNPPVFIIKFS